MKKMEYDDYNPYETEGEPYTEICSRFGCGKELTLHETLCGKRCAEHQGEDVKIVGRLKVNQPSYNINYSIGGRGGGKTYEINQFKKNIK